jgi:hypothetical protein
MQVEPLRLIRPPAHAIHTPHLPARHQHAAGRRHDALQHGADGAGGAGDARDGGGLGGDLARSGRHWVLLYDDIMVCHCESPMRFSLTP